MADQAGGWRVSAARPSENPGGCRAGAGTDLTGPESAMPGLPDRHAADSDAGRIWPTERKTKIPPAAKSVQVKEREVMYLKLTVKQKKFADEYITRKRLWAINELAKRYLSIGDQITREMIEESLAVTRSKKATATQKAAARLMLKLKFGTGVANDIVESFAIVKDRSDPLVQRWIKAVRRRDVICQICESEKHLEVHHISHWADDPVNRIVLENGVLLCSECHSKQHPEISKRMFGGEKHER